MEVDHIFIFSNNQGDEADELAHFGLIEGSNRIHPGQGTRNRKFYFENFFLEIIWVHDQTEIASKLTKPTRLWERANHKISGSSPFGLCLVNSDDTSQLFEHCLKYRPSYLPAGMSFDIITNAAYPYLPWTCRLPSTNKNIAGEPTSHPNGISKLTKVHFGVQQATFQNQFTDLVSEASNIGFQYAARHSLTLEFDHRRCGQREIFDDLSLMIEY